MAYMNAMESIKDKNMLYLDLASGAAGLVLFNLVMNGIESFKADRYPLYLAAFVLIARVVTDYSYHIGVSKTKVYGGTTLEFVGSSMTWFAMVWALSQCCLPSFKGKQIAVLYLSTVVSMMAISRVTGW